MDFPTIFPISEKYVKSTYLRLWMIWKSNIAIFCEICRRLDFATYCKSISRIILSSCEIFLSSTQWVNHRNTHSTVWYVVYKFFPTICCRPLVDTFRMYLCADTDTFSQNVSVPIQIQYQKMYLCADTDTFSDTFWLFFTKI